MSTFKKIALAKKNKIDAKYPKIDILVTIKKVPEHECTVFPKPCPIPDPKWPQFVANSLEQLS